jgi:hypothetical protein
MTGSARFREIALGMTGAEPGSHMGHADFRVGGRIFATLGYPDDGCGAVMLTPEQQRMFVGMQSGFLPARGKWGEQGSTVVRLDEADENAVAEAIELAWRNKSAAPPAGRRKPGRKRAGK